MVLCFTTVGTFRIGENKLQQILSMASSFAALSSFANNNRSMTVYFLLKSNLLIREKMLVLAVSPGRLA